MIKDAEDFAEEDKKVAERAVAKVCNLYIGWFTEKLFLKNGRKSNDYFRMNWNNMSTLSKTKLPMKKNSVANSMTKKRKLSMTVLNPPSNGSTNPER